MKKIVWYLLLSFCLITDYVGAHNNVDISLKQDGRILVSVAHQKLAYRATFYLVYQSADPQMELKNLTECRYFAPVWRAENVPADKIFHEKIYGAEHGGDGIDATLNNKSAHLLTADYFSAGQCLPFNHRSITTLKDTILVDAEVPGYGRLLAKVYTDHTSYPVMEYTFSASRAGYFSVVYAGAPSYAYEAVDELWQPMVWQQRRFPKQSYLTLAYQCSLPATLVSAAGHTYGVLADSSELPFQPLPTRDTNNKFGVMVRNRQGEAQPMLAAPVLGGEHSLMQQGSTFEMKMRLVLSKKEIPEVYSDIASDLFGFRDYRRNEIASTNQVIDRMIDYTLSPYSNFIDSLKGCSYSTDVPGSTKNVSSLHPLSIAIVTDNDSLFENRAMPVMEYMLSRDNFLFCLDKSQKVQNPSRKLGKPCAPASELITLYDLTNQNCDVLKRWAEDKFYRNKPQASHELGRGLWTDGLAMYKAGLGDAYLDWAVRGADYYLKNYVYTKQTTLQKEFFWSAFVPKYIHLLDMYETTSDPKYLEAAHASARYYAMFVWMCPSIPQEQILVNKDNKAPWYWYLKSRGIPQQSAPEETVDAWRLSEIGLTAESPTTGIGHRAVFMAHHAPYFLKIAHYTGDTFLRDIARSAIVGRYRNFPGYHINTMRNTAYEQFDFPYHKHEEISATSFHYNHPFPHISFLIDYLVTDAFDKSNEKIHFPSRHIEGYGYLQNHFYGHAPGQFYAEKEAWLWMPKGLLSIDNVELNYLSARTDHSLCLALLNQCNEDVKSRLSVDLSLAPFLKGQTVTAELWDADHQIGTVELVDGTTQVEVPAKGIRSLVIPNCKVSTRFQEKFVQKGDKWKHASFESQFGDMSALLLDMGKDLKTLYVFLRDDDSVFKEVTMLYRFGKNKFQMITDRHYPFEFTLPVPKGEEEIYVQVLGLDVEGNQHKGDLFKISKQ